MNCGVFPSPGRVLCLRHVPPDISLALSDEAECDCLHESNIKGCFNSIDFAGMEQPRQCFCTGIIVYETCSKRTQVARLTPQVT
jgi:hypothetical protein